MPNICGENIQKGDLSKEDETSLVWASLTTLEGGLDSVGTSSSTNANPRLLTTRRVFPLL